MDIGEEEGRFNWNLDFESYFETARRGFELRGRVGV